MARKDKLVEKLDQYTNILGDIVDILKDEVKSGGDSMDKLASGISDNLSRISEDVKAIKTDISTIKSDTGAIKKAVEQLKTEKEKGLIGDVGDDKNKEQIKDGLKMIMLIAGGVLAIGMAFKIIGSVDVASVLTLSVAMLAMAKTAEMISNIKDLTLKKVIIAGAMMISLSLSIAASSFFLKAVYPVPIGTLITAGLIGIGLSISLVFITKALDNIDLDGKQVAKFLLLPLLLPLLSTSIVLSSHILSGYNPLNLSNMFNLLVGGIVMSIVLVAFSFTLKRLSSLNPKDILMGTLGVIATSVAIVGVAAIFWGAQQIGVNFDPSATPSIEWTIRVGLAGLLFGFALSALGVLPLPIMGMGALGIGIVVLAIVGVAAIFWGAQQLGVSFDPSTAPDIGWTLKVGLAGAIFGVGLTVLGIIPLPILALGALNMAVVAGAIVVASKILMEGDYKTSYPSLKWASGVGLSMATFGLMMIPLGIAMLIPGGRIALKRASEGVGIIAEGIRDVSLKLKGGDYKTSYPTFKWASGVSVALGAFANTLLKLKIMKTSGKDFVEFIANVSDGIKQAAESLSGGKWESGHPTKEWSEGVAIAIEGFSRALEVAAKVQKSTQGIAGLFKKAENSPGTFFVQFIEEVTRGIIKSAEILNASKLNWDSAKYPSKDWVTGVGESISIFSGFIQNIVDTGVEPQKVVKTIKGVLYNVADGISHIAESFQSQDFSKYPNKEWTDSITSIIKVFNKDTDISQLEDFAKGLDILSDINGDKIEKNLTSVSKTLGVLGPNLAAFGNSVGSGIESLINTAGSLAILSVINTDELTGVLDVVEDRVSTLQQVSIQTPKIIENLDKLLSKSKDIKVYTVESKSESDKKNMEKLIQHIENIDKNIGLLVENDGIIDESETDSDELEKGKNVNSNTSPINF